MKKNIRWFVLCSVFVGIVSGCASTPAPAENAWDMMVQEAKREGTVTISGPRGLPAFKAALTEKFTARYGIKVDFQQLGPADVLERVKATPADTAIPWDVFLGGNDTLMAKLKTTGRIAPLDRELVLPEVKDPAKWTGGKIPYFDAAHSAISFSKQAAQFTYVNKARANVEDIKTYRDLLDPKWKGQIVLSRDPRNSGSGRQQFSFFLASPGLGRDFLRDLVQKQEVIIPKTSDEGEQIIKDAKFLICFCDNADGTDLMSRGFVRLNPHQVKEGSYVTSSFANVALAGKAPHPNAAKVFLNWVLTEEAGEATARATNVPSVRVDVPKDFLPSGSIPDPSWPDWSDEASHQQEQEAVKFAEELLGSVRN